jgi:histidinol dehydrogenase
MSESLPLVEIGERGVKAFAARVRGGVRDQPRVEEETAEIIARVREGRDAALRKITRDLDRASVEDLRVPDSEVRDALRHEDPELVRALKFSLNRIRKTQGQLLNRLSFSYVSDGFVVKAVPKPLASVGCYVPGGRAAYASTVLMTAGVAKLAGVGRVIVCSPPSPDGSVNPAILAAASLCGVEEVYAVGGAQSIAAMAYGTESVEKVQKIVGPGGLYASVAKKLVSKDVSIDFFAGPTELVVVGDGSTDAKAAAWDLVGQAEHGEETLCGFVTWDRKTAQRVRAEAARISKSAERGEFVRKALGKGFVALCRDASQAAELVNAIAPEHLEVLCEDGRGFASKVRDAGLVLVGEYAPCAASDYCIGTDHVIPTDGYAKLRSGLSVLDFVKLNWVVEGSKDGLRKVVPSLKSLALAEGLPNHYRSVEERFKR